MNDVVKRWHFNDGSGSSSEPSMYASKSGEYILASDHDRIVEHLETSYQNQIGKMNETITKLRAELETARHVREKLTEQRNKLIVAYRPLSAVQVEAILLDGEIELIESGKKTLEDALKIAIERGEK